MARLICAFAIAAAIGLGAGPMAMAQTKPAPTAPATAAKPAKPAKPAAKHAAKPGQRAAKPTASRTDILKVARKKWDGIGSMTRREWNAMKVTWAREKTKWRACRKRARDQHLQAPNSWTFIGKCMTR